MSLRYYKMALSCAIVVISNFLVSPVECRAAFKVAPGWDLFETTTGTQFPALGALQGVPLGTFDFDNVFGRGLGVQNTGTADTIVTRLDTATGTVAGSMGTSNLRMVALQLKTVAPTNFAGMGLDNYFVTLQSTHGGPASTGMIVITFDATGLSGTFTSSIDVFFDIRKGSLAGPIVYSSDQVLTSDTTAWTNLPPPGALEITGVNRFLSGVNNDRSQDFWTGPFRETHPDGTTHFVTSAVAVSSVPEPASVLLVGIGAIGLGAFGWRHRGRAA